MAENLGIFIGVPTSEFSEVAHLDPDADLEEILQILAASDEEEDEDDEEREEDGHAVPDGLDIEHVDGMPELDEALVRSQLTALGATLLPGQDEGSWVQGTVAYDFLLCRGENSRLRMVDGTIAYLSPTAVASRDVRAVFTGLLKLAETVGARLWQTGGVIVPIPLGREDIDGWIREMSDDLP
ncbi:hypothetical protein [Kineococcus aurantiacus]|uniref:Uncharacterized protein n=1 Tax=Kineococcus aurantiacus TaxID=37633 RepID=A0A7Y9DQP3_9ACTN|nr:hypothetical protein [Kineococcus aurantiacus]NYD25050.1 hypothetical protein [Kineococcus aurantiacus]